MDVELPTVDISLLGTCEEQNLVNQVNNAFSKLGFLNLTGHGLSDIYEELEDELKGVIAGVL